MGWRFRKRIKIAPGVNINLSKSGISTTFGGKWGSVNVGKNGTYLNTGVRGTGFYRRDKIGGSNLEGNTNKQNIDEEPNARNGNNWGCCFGGCGIILLLLIIWMALGIYFGIGAWANEEGAKDAFLGYIILAVTILIIPVFLYIKRLWERHKQKQEVEATNVKPKSINESKESVSYKESLKNTNLDYYNNLFINRFDSTKYDPLFVDAAYLTVDSQLGSTSLLQKELRIGFNRVSRIMNQLEEAGIVGASKGSTTRDVLIPNFQELDNLLSKLSGIDNSENS